MIIVTLFAGMAIGAVAMALIDRRRSGVYPSARRARPGRRHHDSAADRDLHENAGGSRHIRTHPSWRDRLEQPRPTGGEINRTEELP
ncbi:hypothetical protein J2W56_003441 [Nocardia kruczakiae]|uniref:Secreted protein n=1 Tax=Nocardia kruczakiae TaxID=261477 RepID=A0ABU1XIA8_9NOCA|nr:hypothetical protein [Nocardia kruczakiae]